MWEPFKVDNTCWGFLPLLQTETRERLHRLLFGLASVWRPDRLHRHRGSAGPAGRGRRSTPRHKHGTDLTTALGRQSRRFGQLQSKVEQTFQQPAAKAPVKDYDDLFDDDDDDRVMDEGLSDTRSPVKKAAAGDDDDDDFFMPATGRARNRGVILDDENSLGEWINAVWCCHWQILNLELWTLESLSTQPPPHPLQTPDLWGSVRKGSARMTMRAARSRWQLLLRCPLTPSMRDPCPHPHRRRSSRAPPRHTSHTASWYDTHPTVKPSFSSSFGRTPRVIRTVTGELSHRCGTRWASCEVTMTSRTTPLT